MDKLREVLNKPVWRIFGTSCLGIIAGQGYATWIAHLPAACYKGPVAPVAMLTGGMLGLVVGVFSKS